jgi:SNF2 family DNA or RNA helicase
MNIYTQIESQPEYIKAGQLQHHQITGLDFLAYSWYKKNNVVLADEMGLGKSVLTI